VTLTDRNGTTTVASVAAGTEVEILAWQPFGVGGTRYRVLAAKDGSEGWLGAANVKARELPPALTISAPSAPAARIDVPGSRTRGRAPALPRTQPGSGTIALKIGKRPTKSKKKRGN
jgi:hypothetical protein